jgi:hypothetical protein
MGLEIVSIILTAALALEMMLKVLYLNEAS